MHPFFLFLPVPPYRLTLQPQTPVSVQDDVSCTVPLRDSLNVSIPMVTVGKSLII